MTTPRRPFLLLLPSLVLAACGGGPATPSSDPGAWVIYTSSAQGQTETRAVREDGSGDHAVAQGGAVGAANGRVISSVSAGGLTDLWSARVDGGDARAISATAGSDELVLVGPGGRLVIQVASPETGTDLVAMDADGGGKVTLAATAVGETALAVAGDRLLFSVTGPAGELWLRTVRLDGTGGAALAEPPGADAILSALTAGGQAVVTAFTAAGEREVHAVPVAGGPATPLWVEAGVEKVVAGVTPQGQVIVAARPAGGGQDDLYAVPADGSAPPVPVAASPDHETFAGVTPDGRLLYQRTVGPQDLDLHLVRADGTADTAIAPSAAVELLDAVADDGRLVLRRVQGANRDVLCHDPATGLTTPLAATPDQEDLVALRGTTALFSRRVAGGGQLRAISLDGTGERPLVTDLPLFAFEGFTPAGRLLFTTREADQLDLWIMEADGTGRRRLAGTARSEEAAGLLP